MIEQCPEERFLRDVSDHAMTVIRDDGVSRHIRFAKPGTGEMHFDLITWPGYLCYTGDMGTYVFQRLADMFKFFRRNDKSYRIDFRYWAEKVEAADKGDGIKRFSFETFKAQILDWIKQGEDGSKPDDDEPEQLLKWAAAYDELRAEVQDEVLDDDSNAVRCFDRANEFRHTGDAWQEFHGSDSRFEFTDFWEVDCEEYTHRFVWCCNALAWGIAKYDAAKTPVSEIKEATCTH